ncbi:MAG: DsbA family protein [Patulibacter sp.]|nr:DsbA family protein [Patulibacter sp.]
MSDDPSSAPSSGPHVRGPGDARLVVLFGDVTCDRCQQAYRALAGAPIRLQWRHFVLRARGPRPRAVATALEAAARQDAFWPMLDRAMAQPGRLEDPDLWQIAADLDLDIDRFRADRRDERTAEAISGDLFAGMGLGATGTPALVVDGTVDHGVPDAAWVAAVVG